jgi:hypothetical protein
LKSRAVISNEDKVNKEFYGTSDVAGIFINGKAKASNEKIVSKFHAAIEAHLQLHHVSLP